jgi:hypothetical protein
MQKSLLAASHWAAPIGMRMPFPLNDFFGNMLFSSRWQDYLGNSG